MEVEEAVEVEVEEATEEAPSRSESRSSWSETSFDHLREGQEVVSSCEQQQQNIARMLCLYSMKLYVNCLCVQAFGRVESLFCVPFISIVLESR